MKPRRHVNPFVHLQRRSLESKRGHTLVELMISVALGMLIVAAGISIFLSSKTSYMLEDDTARLLDAGNFALENITQGVRQAAFENLDDSGAPIMRTANMTPNIHGFDNKTFGAPPGTGLPPLVTSTSHQSDILQLRFFGASKNVNGAPVADGTMLNCAGDPIAAPLSAALAESDRGWTVFFLKSDPSGEPELHCGYLDKNNTFKSIAIARGVESFQVLYGIDTDDDDIPNQFVDAKNLDAASPAAPGISLWNKVVAIRVSLLIRGSRISRADGETNVYDLFGPTYTASSSTGGITQFDEATLTGDDKGRSRKLFTTLIQLRNRPQGGNIAPL